MRTAIVALVLATLAVGAAASEQDFYRVEPGKRRDPFSFAPVAPEAEKPQPPGPPPQTPQEDLAAMRAKLSGLCSGAVSALLEDKWSDAMKNSDEGLAALKALRAEDRAFFYRERDELLRVSKAAQRSMQRIAAENELKRLNISITGLLLRDRQPEAIVNAKLLRPGDTVSVPDAEDVPVVREIRADGVVMRFRGYLIGVDFTTGPGR